MKLIVRGDLRSEAGWSRATRALLDAVKRDFSLIAGVDLHYHPARSRTEFPYAVIDDKAATKLIGQCEDGVVLHVVLPPQIERVAGAINLGWWFWETNTFSRTGDWAERLDSLDAILVPSQWQADWLSQWNLRPPIYVLPWPQQAKSPRNGAHETCLNGLELCRTWSIEEYAGFLAIEKRNHSVPGRLLMARDLVWRKIQMFRDTCVPPGAIGKTYDGYFFAVQTDAPRKGLPVLLNEWKKYRAQAKTNKALVVRFSSLDVNLTPVDVVARFMNTALSASRGNISALDHVYLLVNQVSEDILNDIYASAAAFIAPTYGEGFGSTIVESAFANCLPIAPDHTACNQLLPPDYLYKYKSFPYIGALIDQLPIQPSNGTWHLPEPGAISRCLLDIETISASARTLLTDQLLGHMTELLSPAKARATVNTAIAVANAKINRYRRSSVPELTQCSPLT